MFCYLSFLKKPQSAMHLAMFVMFYNVFATLAAVSIVYLWCGVIAQYERFGHIMMLALVVPQFIAPPLLYLMGIIIMRLNAVRQALEHLIRTDSMTGLLNRRGFFERAEALMAARKTQNAHILLLDIDRFKQINDTYGHAAGDRVLTGVAHILKRTVEPDSGFVARLGGDELCIFMQGPANGQALELAERMRSTVAHAEFIHGAIIIKTSISMGMTPLKAGDTCLDLTLARADKALYAAKNGGRNMVKCVHFPPSSIPVTALLLDEDDETWALESLPSGDYLLAS